MLHGFLRRWRIQALLLVTFFVLNVSLLAILGVVSYSAVADEITRGAGQASLAALRDASKRLALRLAVVEDTALALSLNPGLEPVLLSRDSAWDEARALDRARELIAPYTRHPEIAGIHIFVRGWRIAPYVTGGTGLVAEEAVKGEAWYQPVREFDSGWLGLHGNTIYPNSPTRDLLTYVRKVYASESGQLLGVIAVDVRPVALRTFLEAGEWEGSLFITGPAGEFVHQVTGPPHGSGLGELVRHQVTQREASYTPFQLEDRPALLLSTEPIHGGLRLVQAVPVDALTKGLARIRLAFLWGGAACAALSLVLAWLLSRSFLRPIQVLVEAMKQVSEGRLDVRVTVRHQNEFGELEQGFNHMGARLEQLVDDLGDAYRRKRQAELEALQAQINPHFLYNTLDMINWMAIGEKQTKISQVVTLLGRFFRLGLSQGEALVPLRQELEHLNTYIQLQQIRFRGVFRVQEEFEPGLLEYCVPKILLQPFVENCLRHAFADRGGQGTIRLAGAVESGALVLTVADDGLGMAEGAVPDPRRVGTGYGIRNVAERIQVLFGPAYGIAVESQPMKGTRVRIKLPLIRKGEQDANLVGHVG
ncbi:MAG: cache domain-containing sensor histidine kinase [Bacillota bacterium]